jgi:hypothetical protein
MFLGIWRAFFYNCSKPALQIAEIPRQEAQTSFIATLLKIGEKLRFFIDGSKSITFLGNYTENAVQNSIFTGFS